MTIDFVRCPRLLSQMVGAKFEFAEPVRIQLFTHWLGREASAWPMMWQHTKSHWREGAFQQVRFNYPYDKTTTVQLGFRGPPEVTVRRHIPPEFKAYLRTNYDDDRCGWFVWEAHNLSDVGVMRCLLIKFDAAVREMTPQAKQVEAPFVRIKHPVTNDFKVNLDGKRSENEQLYRLSNQLWLPYGADKPVKISRHTFHKRKWARRLAKMTPAGQAMVKVLVG